MRIAGVDGRPSTELGSGFFDVSTVATPLPIDGVHLDAENTAAIGRALAPDIRDLLGL